MSTAPHPDPLNDQPEAATDLQRLIRITERKLKGIPDLVERELQNALRMQNPRLTFETWMLIPGNRATYDKIKTEMIERHSREAQAMLDALKCHQSDPSFNLLRAVTRILLDALEESERIDAS